LDLSEADVKKELDCNRVNGENTLEIKRERGRTVDKDANITPIKVRGEEGDLNRQG
jgi:hypothetical protein